MSKRSVLIADDHFIVREGLRLILETVDTIEVVGEAQNGAEAVALAIELKPDVVLMDLRMPEMDGLEAIERLAASQPETAVVILTTYNEDDWMLRGLQAGARGFLLKDTPRSRLIETIEAAARGETLLSPDAMQKLVANTRKPAQTTSSDSGIQLTDREIEVLQAVAAGDTNKGVALQLGISERTVKAHLSSVFNKLGVDSRAAAIAVAADRGWLTKR